MLYVCMGEGKSIGGGKAEENGGREREGAKEIINWRGIETVRDLCGETENME